jgi:small-conductance mechanosensitive channel
MEDFFNLDLFSLGDKSISVGMLLLGVLSIVSCIFLLLVARKILRSEKFQIQLGVASIKTIRQFIYVVILFFGLFAALESFNIDFSNFLKTAIISTKEFEFLVMHIFIFYLIITGTKVILSFIQYLIDAKIKEKEIEPGKSHSIFQILKYFIYVIAISIFVNSLGVNITILIASVSALLVGIGLGIQHFFNDVISGMVMLFDHSIKVNDTVEIEGDLIGRVIKINLRTSVILTRENVIMIIPNSHFTTERVINWTHNAKLTRFTVSVGVAYGSDVRLVEKLLIEAAMEHPEVSENPKPFVLFSKFGESSLDFDLKFWSEHTFLIEPIRSDLRFAIDQKFRENGVTIPFPQQDVYIKTPIEMRQGS